MNGLIRVLLSKEVCTRYQGLLPAGDMSSVIILTSQYKLYMYDKGPVMNILLINICHFLLEANRCPLWAKP